MSWKKILHLLVQLPRVCRRWWKAKLAGKTKAHLYANSVVPLWQQRLETKMLLWITWKRHTTFRPTWMLSWLFTDKFGVWAKFQIHSQQKRVCTRSQGTSNWSKIYWRTSSYAGVRTRTPCIFLTFFIFVKNSFSMPINCLNCQRGLVISKIYQTDAKET